MKFYSQFGEDKFLYENFLNYKNGFFIEMGAMNGVLWSNTKFFEDELGWNGILIEPTIQYEDLIINRPKCYNFNFAISEKSGDVSFLSNSTQFEIGGILESMNDKHKMTWNLNDTSPYYVKSLPLYEITKNINIERVDLLSIDVEGGELGVLKTFDWRIPVYLILIELDGNNKEKDRDCRELLKEKGFEFCCKIPSDIDLNEIWTKKSNSIENTII